LFADLAMPKRMISLRTIGLLRHGAGSAQHSNPKDAKHRDAVGTVSIQCLSWMILRATGAAFVRYLARDDDWTVGAVSSSRIDWYRRCPHCHWTDGGLIDLEAIELHSQLGAHCAGCNPSVGASADVKRVDADFVASLYMACSGRTVSLSLRCTALERVVQSSTMDRAQDLRGFCWSGQLQPRISRRRAVASCRERATLPLMPGPKPRSSLFGMDGAADPRDAAVAHPSHAPASAQRIGITSVPAVVGGPLSRIALHRRDTVRSADAPCCRHVYVSVRVTMRVTRICGTRTTTSRNCSRV